MAKKKKQTSKAKVTRTTRAKQGAAVKAPKSTKPTTVEAVPVEAAKKVALAKVAKLVEPAPDQSPQIPDARRVWRPTALERLALILGAVLLILAVVAMVQQRPTHDTESNDVKQQTLNFELDDFKSDPAIQQAIQKQLGGNSDAAPTPQQQGAATQSGTGASQALQAPAGNVQQQR